MKTVVTGAAGFIGSTLIDRLSTARDYIYVGDIADAFVRAAEIPKSVTVFYNIGTRLQTTVLDLHWPIADAVGCDLPPVFAPLRTGEVPRIALGSSKARCELEWTPLVQLENGVKRTVSWLRELGSRQSVPAEAGEYV